MTLFSRKSRGSKDDLDRIQQKVRLQSHILTNITIVGMSLEEATTDAGADPAAVKEWLEQDEDFKQRVDDALSRI